jgi:hypothetical protein
VTNRELLSGGFCELPVNLQEKLHRRVAVVRQSESVRTERRQACAIS